MIGWINPKERKPEGKLFWALTGERLEGSNRDWEIRKLINGGTPNYRSLDYSSSYYIVGTYNSQASWQTIYAWLPIDEITLEDIEWING